MRIIVRRHRFTESRRFQLSVTCKSCMNNILILGIYEKTHYGYKLVNILYLFAG